MKTNDLAQQVVVKLRQLGKTLCTAESCTGGQIAAAITKIPGSSEVFLGGVVAYANSAKQSLLGVDEATLGEYGAVSEQVAKQMALGAIARFGADFAIATTGIAGPGGGTEAKPVGLVCFAWANRVSVQCVCENLSGNREEVQTQAVEKALGEVLARL